MASQDRALGGETAGLPAADIDRLLVLPRDGPFVSFALEVRVEGAFPQIVALLVFAQTVLPPQVRHQLHPRRSRARALGSVRL
ncbi:hypothetical protein A6A29_37890 [Streptomyces sp. TSRI0281]|nr:hypothetical protein A6A29_37890 [Streptomyces sp. TSRI0281]